MKHIIDLAWKENMAFETNMDGHTIKIDLGAENGGADMGPRPKKFMLTALAGCTAMDVVSILKKMKVVPEAFHVVVEADVTETDPKTYSGMKVVYQFKGSDLSMSKLEKVVNLSFDKYCGVSAFYRQVVDIKTEIRIID